MTSTAELLSRYRIGKKQFYLRRDCLTKLGYDLQGQKMGRTCIYSPEQVELLDRLNQHLQSHRTMDEFPPAGSTGASHCAPATTPERQQNGSGNGSELVTVSHSSVETAPEPDEEIYVDTNPIEDIKEQQLDSVHVAAQYSAAQNLTAFNYLTLDYMKHRDFTVEGLAEEVHKSEQAVRESFASMMESPEQATKKLLARIRQRRSQK